MRYLWWLVTSQPWRVLAGALTGSLWMVGIVLEPFFIRGAIDHGLVAGEPGALAQWTAALAGFSLVTAGVGLMRHRVMTFIRTDAAYRTVQVVTRKVARLGAVLPRRVATGEVVTVGTTDIWHVAQALTVTGPGVGALVAFGVVGALVVAISPQLGLLVLLGVPVVTVVVGPLLQRLQRTEAQYRRRQGALTARASDIVAGLRVLRGIGGEDLFAGRYRDLSQQLRADGYRVGAVISWVRALAAGLPALFVGVIAWLAARLVAQGAITVGDMVAVYAYAVVLAVPVAFLVEGGHQIVRALVAARRVIAVLDLPPEIGDDPGPAATGAPPPADLHDPASGLTVVAGQLLVVVADDQSDVAALADRLGRYADSDVTLAGVPLRRLPLAQVRQRIMVADTDAHLFAGTLRDMLRQAGEVDDAMIARALHAAAAGDVVDGLPDGLDTPLGTQARTLSGGQRQRVRLARALLADPEVLVLIEPTSAVDAHTEQTIAQQLHEVRAGRTTVVFTASPLLLDQSDRVAFLSGGRVAATGTHPELLTSCADYRTLVVRGSGTEPVPTGQVRP